MELNILGTTYTLTVKSYDEDPYFKDNFCDGYCDDVTKEIAICNLYTHPEFKKETAEYCDKAKKQIIRHEIIHAFLNESGLKQCSSNTGPWARNEEMVDWIAIQATKIIEVFKAVNCL